MRGLTSGQSRLGDLQRLNVATVMGLHMACITGGSMRDLRGPRQQFWSRFLEKFSEGYPEWRPDTIKKRQDRSIGFPAAGPGMYRYRAGFCQRNGRLGLRAELCIKTDDENTTNKAYDELHEANHDKLKEMFGEDLAWKRLDGNKISRISLYFPGEIRIGDEKQWPEAQAWLIEVLGKLQGAFDPVLEKLEP